MSRVNFGAKPFMYPMPVLIIGTYDENGVPNAMNAAWGIITDFNEISISMSEHKTTENLAVTGAFTVSIATESMVVPCDYVGVESASKVPDKFARAGFHATKSAFVNAPLIDELPMALECKVKSYENDILVGEIVNVNAEECILTDGRIDPKKLKPITYDPVNHAYIGLGEKVGNAFKDGLQLKELNLNGKFEFRTIRPEEADRAVIIEQICFPPNEACSEKHMKERIAKAPELFLVAVDKETGKIAGFLNGLSTKENSFRDEYFTDADLYDPEGTNVMLLGLDVLPEYRGQGLAREIVRRYSMRERENGREKLILTCLDSKVEMYKKFGFQDDGIANSTWGGEEWHEMSIVIK